MQIRALHHTERNEIGFINLEKGVMFEAMDCNSFVLSVVTSCPDSVCPGRTVLQKVAYFAAAIVGSPNHHRAHYFGPYSVKIANARSSLVSLGFLDEKRSMTNLGTWGYEYKITRDGQTVYDNVIPEAFRAKIDEAVGKITSQEGWNNTTTVSMAAKTFFLLDKTRNSMTTNAVSREAKKLGWRLDEDTIERSLGFLEGLDLPQTL